MFLTHFTFFISSTINPTIAAFASFIDDLYKSWIGLCWCQIVIFNALLIFKFPRISGIDDIFMGRFMLIINILFIFLLHTARFYFFGSFHEASQYQIFTGIRVSYEADFWPKFTMILALAGSISFISVTWKKASEKYKDYKIQNEIHINLPIQGYGKLTYGVSKSGI